MRVLLVEDDRRLARLITSVLADEQITADVAYDGDDGVDLAMRGVYDVAIVDWMLPGRDGPAVCRAIRSARLPTAVLMLTARGQVEDRVAGLNAGADDYLVKPFAFEELLARVHALGRRFVVSSGDRDELRVGEIVLDSQLRRARRGDHTLELTPTEWKLLEFFLRHPDQALNRQQVLDYVWSCDADVLPTMVDVYISYLRGKLRVRGRADPIETVRGVGYRLKSNHV